MLNAGLAGAICGLLTVALGAFGAHALKFRLSRGDAGSHWRTAVNYQGLHSLALLWLANSMESSSELSISVWFFLAGIVLFSGSLYLLALGAPRKLGIVTPLGGVAWLAAWGLVALHFMKSGA